MKFKLLFILIIFSLSSFAQQDISEKQVLQKIDSINSDPFSEEIKEATAEVLYWIQKSSNIDVMDIELFAGAIKNSNRDLAPYLLRAYFFGKVKNTLRGDSAGDSLAAKIAGLESLVKVYNQYLENEPAAANAEADKLAAMQESQLRAYVISFENRDALSYETAIIPKSIIEEYEWMAKNYPEAQMLGKSLIQYKGRTYDVFEIQKKDNEKIKLYFDTSLIL